TSKGRSPREVRFRSSHGGSGCGGYTARADSTLVSWIDMGTIGEPLRRAPPDEHVGPRHRIQQALHQRLHPLASPVHALGIDELNIHEPRLLEHRANLIGGGPD